MDEKILQTLTLENKEVLNITGVNKVDNFNEDLIVLNTNKGKLTIKGGGMSISKLNVEEGRLMVKGEINSLVYSENDAERDKTSLIKKIFK